MPYHYTKSGSLDMRYSSSKAAVSSGYSGGGSSGGGGGSRSSGGYSSGNQSQSSYAPSPSYSSSSSTLNYKSDGSLDMRYSSSKSAVASDNSASSGYSSANTSVFSPLATSTENESSLHHKKDGSLDMRFSSSKVAVAASDYSGSSLASSIRSTKLKSSDSGNLTQDFDNMSLHHKKDGTLDMRYASSKAATATAVETGKSQSLQKTSLKNIPVTIPLTKKGLPDMRTTEAKNWVKEQASHFKGVDYLPPWIPRTKDGSVDFSKAVTNEFFKGNGYESLKSANIYNPCHRENYYKEKLQQELFRRYVEDVRISSIEIPNTGLLRNTREIKAELEYPSTQNEKKDSVLTDCKVPLIKEHELAISSTELGRGAFGVVTKGSWRGVRVAVKRLHLQKLSKSEKAAFIKEVHILANLGAHPNLVGLYGYMLDPPTMVLEFVKLGSLNYMLHYNEDSELEAKMTDGRIKKRIVVGIINGMQQIHGVNIVHGDLKPQNILVSKTFEAKITDFGLATLRGKTGSSTKSTVTADGDVVIGGTAGYIAPELLVSTLPPELSCDVYSFGIVLNEIIQEEEPYSDQFKNFLGRGPFAAANYAKLGNRPKINSRTPSKLVELIQKCWSVKPQNRPTFDRISKDIEPIEFPNSF